MAVRAAKTIDPLFAILLLTMGPSKAAIVFASITAPAGQPLRRPFAVQIMLAGAVVVIMAINYLCLCLSEAALAAIGAPGTQVLARFLGVFVVAVAMQLMIMTGPRHDPEAHGQLPGAP